MSALEIVMRLLVTFGLTALLSALIADQFVSSFFELVALLSVIGFAACFVALVWFL